MDEEIDTRKINNSFLRDHNYATEGISHHMIASSQVHIESEIQKELFGISLKGCWFGLGKTDWINWFYFIIYLFIEKSESIGF